MQEQRKQGSNSTEIINMRSQGINAVDLFNIKQKVRNYNVANEDMLNELKKFMKTEGDKVIKQTEIAIDYQGNIIGHQVLSHNSDIVAAKNTSDHLLEMMRVIGIESREIIGDIIELKKMLEVKQFEDNPTITL